MNKDGKKIEKITAQLIKNSGMEYPSVDFTTKVMLSINLEAASIKRVKRINYRWFLLLIPVFGIIIWYLIAVLKLSEYVLYLRTFFSGYIQPFINQFTSSFAQLKHLNISPVLIIGFTAIISLLTFEELRIRLKHSSS